MNIVITGAGGYIGRALCARLIALGHSVAGTDRGGDAPPGLTPWQAGDIADPNLIRALITPGTHAVIHLAGIVSGAAEADFDLGMHVNLDGLRNVLDACRQLAHPPRFAYSSSIAVYGVPLPATIDDATLAVPTLSYGTQKLIGEQLINDYSRRGFIDGVALRLPGIVVRPPMPNGALSAFNSDIIREPFAGQPITSPVSVDATIWILSLAQCVDNFVHAITMDARALGPQRALLSPAIAVSVRELLDRMSELAGRDLWRHVTFAPNPDIEPMFGRWPARFTATRAVNAGFTVDDDLHALLRQYIAVPPHRDRP